MVLRPRHSLLLSLLSLLAACGGGEPPALVSGTTRLRLTRAGDAPPPEQVVRRIAPPPTPGTWSSDAPAQAVVEVEGADALRLRGGRRQEILIPGAFAPGEFNLVAIEAAAQRGTTLRVGLRSAAGVELGSLDVGFLAPGESKRVEFDLRALAGATDAFDQLVLLANRSDKAPTQLDWILLGLELIDRPLERWLPTVDGPPALIDLAGESRRGFGLSSGAGLRAAAAVPADARLRLGFGPAPRDRAPDESLRLVVCVDGQEVARARPPSGWGARAWGDLELDLGRWAGAQVELGFALEGDGARPASASLSQPVLVSADRDAPTVLLITSDTHRAGYLGRAGLGVRVRTPNLDSLAARGVLFEDCFASANSTLPSHVALMTGRDPAATGVIDNRTRLAERAGTLAERFATAGWTTFAATSAKHMNDPWSGLGQGFDRFGWPARERERVAPQTVSQLMDWLPSARGQPLFLWLHVFDAHRPYAPPEEIARAYYGDGDPFDPALPEPDWPPPPNLRGLRDAAWAEALYRGEVSYLDGQLARVLAAPRVAAGVVAFTSDHGEALGDQGIWWEHLGLYPAVLHVPLILSWPGAPAGRRVRAPVRQSDLGRTLLALAGLPDEDFGGLDLAPAWSAGELAPTPRFAFGSDAHALAVTSAGWHLVVNLRVPKPEAYTRDPVLESPVELFDLRSDPQCTRDLSASEAARVSRLGRALLRWVEAAEGSLAERNELDPEAEGMLAGLGYAATQAGGGALIDLDLVRARLAPWLGE